MQPSYEYGDQVRLIRNVRNDGTYPGIPTGTLLMRRGEVGHVLNVGTFLQDQLIYTVHFLGSDRRIGCREEELIDAALPWMPSRFETREKVSAGLALSVDGEVLVPQGAIGEVFKVIREFERGQPFYHVQFPGRLLVVPENALSDAVEVETER
jgi:nitrogen fixation protein NifZ